MRVSYYKEKMLTIASIFLCFSLFRFNLIHFRLKTFKTNVPSFNDTIYYRKALVKISLILVGSTLFPILIQNIYNLFYTNPAFQLFFEDIDSFILTLLLIILLLVNIYRTSKQIKIDEINQIE